MHIFFRTALLGLVAAARSAHRPLRPPPMIAFPLQKTSRSPRAIPPTISSASPVASSLQGDVHGDIVTVLGGIKAEGSRAISGDVVALGGDVSPPRKSRPCRAILWSSAATLTWGPEASCSWRPIGIPRARLDLSCRFAPLLILVGNHVAGHLAGSPQPVSLSDVSLRQRSLRRAHE